MTTRRERRRSHLSRDRPPFTALAQNDFAVSDADVSHDVICQTGTDAQHVFHAASAALELESSDAVLDPRGGLRPEDFHLVRLFGRFGHGSDGDDCRLVRATGVNELTRQLKDSAVH